jgi:hypothetical protein
MGLAFWILLGTDVTGQRLPTTSRYIYPSAIFLLLIILELTRGIRATPRVVGATIGVVLISLVPNLVNLRDRAYQIRSFALIERADLAALELLRREVPPTALPGLTRTRALAVSPGILYGQGFRFASGHGQELPASRYFQSAAENGSTVSVPRDLLTAREAQRQAIDKVLLKGNDLTLSNAPGSALGGASRCLPPRAPGPRLPPDRPLQVPEAGLVIQPNRSRAQVAVLARRFSSTFEKLDVPAGSGPLLLKPGRNQLFRPWLVEIKGATACPT